ncbi:hypothetical protein NQZ68_030752 [Dissostichus eleginoides]|nr:hypothetical protein NQZ68_030752 [Dissostichus eleginoides]
MQNSFAIFLPNPPHRVRCPSHHLGHKNQSEMELLTTALVIALLSTTASAKPIGRHQNADIAGNNLILRWLRMICRGSSWSAESSSYSDSSSESSESLESESSESSESQSSESQSSEESSEERPFTDQTTMGVTPTAMTTITNVKRSTPTPEPDTGSTDGPTDSGRTVPPATPTPSEGTTSSGCSECFTLTIPTAFPITEKRGDN